MIGKPLEGVKVVDLTYFVAGPGSAKILADWGADVIKVEPSFGDPGRKTGATMMMPISEEQNPFYETYNSNKRGLSLNLKDPKGIEILHKLLSTANVFVSSYRTGALKRLGLDYETLKEKHPHLIWAQINGFGDYGPAKDNAGFDTVAFWARSGVMLDLTEEGTNPVNPIIAFGDATTAGTLAGGISAALYHQLKTGEGQKVMISLFGQAIWTASAAVVSTQYGDKYQKTRKNAVSPVINSYRCKDGKWIFLSILEHERYYETLCKLLKREDLIGNKKFSTTLASKENAIELIKILDGEFIKYTQDELVEMLTKADIAHERIKQIKEVISDPQALVNNYVYEFEHENKEKSILASTPIKFETIDLIETRPAPKIGEHGKEILKELKYTEEEINEYLETGVLYIQK